MPLPSQKSLLSFLLFHNPPPPNKKKFINSALSGVHLKAPGPAPFPGLSGLHSDSQGQNSFETQKYGVLGGRISVGDSNRCLERKRGEDSPRLIESYCMSGHKFVFC